ncbi:DUF3180 domain-containing protein [Demequina sp. NBRC 110056]|uniref:DUF3180 domain-containing protein n=1 Tax=Demequina sp. NBRC 110056 TaxID=1570345 RepID=UPI00135629E9|nr:DUF3180 domain-containing protein [Demequina sp. NBRC 110056]
MQHLTWQRLAAVGLAALALAWILTDQIERGGATPLAVPWTFDVVCVAAGVLALWLGWQVRQYLAGKKPELDGLRAARTVVYAQASAYVGAIIAGACGGYALGLLDGWSHGPRREVIISALIAAACALAMMVAGIIAERWCRHGGDDELEQTDAQPA